MIILIFLFHLITKMDDHEIYSFGMILMNFHLHKERGFFFFFFWKLMHLQHLEQCPAQRENSLFTDLTCKRNTIYIIYWVHPQWLMFLKIFQSLLITTPPPQVHSSLMRGYCTRHYLYRLSLYADWFWSQTDLDSNFNSATDYMTSGSQVFSPRRGWNSLTHHRVMTS